MSKSGDEPKKLKLKFLIEAEIDMSDEHIAKPVSEPETALNAQPTPAPGIASVVQPSLSGSFMKLTGDKSRGAAVLADLYNQPEFSHLDPMKRLQKLRENASKVEAFILSTGELLRR